VLAAPAQPRSRWSRFVALAAFALVLAAVAIVIVNSARSSHTRRAPAQATHGSIRHVPPYWIVRPGDTYAQIAATTGLTIAQLEAFNPDVDPLGLAPGERLNLWAHPPRPRPAPPGPKFWTVRSGDSFGLIAVKTGINLDKLEQLNPQFRNSTLQPGDRIRLRP
jgi:LysM repeat protein